jgi:hypothetical protein
MVRRYKRRRYQEGGEVEDTYDYTPEDNYVPADQPSEPEPPPPFDPSQWQEDEQPPPMAMAQAPFDPSQWKEDEQQAAPFDPSKWKEDAQAEGAWGAFTREALHGAPPAMAAAAGGVLTGAAAGAFVPVPGATLVGGLVGGFGAGMAGEAATDKIAKGLGIEDDAVRAANIKEHPFASAAGQAVSNLAGFSPRGIASAGARMVSAGISAAGETASQIYQKGKEFFTPEGIKEAAPFIAAQGAMGAAAPNLYKWGEALEKGAYQVAGRYGGRIPEGHPAAGGETRPPPPDPAAGGETRPPPDPSGQHGQTPGSETGPGVAQEPKPPAGDRQPAGGEDANTTKERYAKPEATPADTGVTEIPDVYRGLNEGDYRTPAYTGEPTAPPSRGMNVGEIDPTVSHALTREAQTEGGERAPGAGRPGEEAVTSEPRAPPTAAETPPRDAAAGVQPEPARGQPGAAREPTRHVQQPAETRVHDPRDFGARPAEPIRSAPAPEKTGYRATRNPDGTWALKNRDGNIVGNYRDLGEARKAIAGLQRSEPAANQGLRREPVVRGRDGRPVQTARLPIGNERAVLERGARRVAEGVPPGTPRPPQRQAQQRQGPDITKVPDQELHARGNDPKTGILEREAIIKELQRRQAARLQQPQQTQPPGQQRQPPPAQRRPPPPPPPPGGGPGQQRRPPPPPPPGGPPPGGGPGQQRQPPPAQRRPAQVAPALQPATKWDLQQGLFSSLRRMFVPMVSKSAQHAGAALRKAAGPLARLREQTANRFSNDLHKVANRMDRPAFEKFVDAYESGQVHTLPREQQSLAKALKENYDDFWKEIQKLPKAGQLQATQNYLTHMYDNSNGQVTRFTSNWFSASGGSLRARTHPTFADARAAGLQPLSNNPIEHFSRYSEGMSHYLSQQRMIEDLKGQGRIGYFNPKTIGASGSPHPKVMRQPPDGYSKIEVPWTGQQRGPVHWDAYAPRDVAETINQFYAAGLRNAQTKDIYEFLQRTKNTWTAVELGLSAYHATTMSVESVAAGMARALQLAARGDFKRATVELLKSPTEPITSYLYGRQMRQVYRDTTGTLGTPLQRRLMDIFSQANVRPGNLAITREYDMSKLGNFWDAGKRGSLTHEIMAQMKEIRDSYGLKLPSVLLDNVRRAMQTISKPLFEHYIPELKLGTMMKDVEAWLHSHPTATDEQILHYARKASDSVDNRMGEMNYDNLFMNKTAKDLGMLTLRSFGFTVGGPVREIGAGVGSLAKAVATGKSPIKHIADDPRTAYAMAFLPAIAAVSAAYQYMRTGKGPEDWRDLVTPKTGGTIKSIGQKVPERILVPGYHKDFLGYFVNPSGPLHELDAKLAAPWTTLKEQLTGKDWRDQKYTPPRASALEWLQAHARQAGSHMKPIGPTQLYEGKKPGSALTTFEQMLGVRTPGAYMLNPKGLERFSTEKAQREWSSRENRENRERQERGEKQVPHRKLPKQEKYARGGPVRTGYSQRGYQEGGEVEPDELTQERDDVDLDPVDPAYGYDDNQTAGEEIRRYMQRLENSQLQDPIAIEPSEDRDPGAVLPDVPAPLREERA